MHPPRYKPDTEDPFATRASGDGFQAWLDGTRLAVGASSARDPDVLPPSGPYRRRPEDRYLAGHGRSPARRATRSDPPSVQLQRLARAAVRRVFDGAVRRQEDLVQEVFLVLHFGF